MVLHSQDSQGFTLIELLVVVLIIGALAAIAVPQFFRVVERGRFAESLQWLDGLRGAQERYLIRHGNYYAGALGTTTSPPFDAQLGPLAKFTAGILTTTASPSWALTLTRNSPCPAVYGCYTVSYAAPSGALACTSTDCAQDLMPN